MNPTTALGVMAYIWSVAIVTLWKMGEISYEGSVLVMLTLIAILIASGAGAIVQR